MAEIVVGVDGSRDSENALRWAVREARLRGLRVRAVFAWTPSGPPHPDVPGPPSTSPEHPRWVAQRLLLSVVDRVRATEPDAAIIEQITFRPPVAALLEVAGPQAMLVVGARGLGDSHRMLTGSVSLACVHGAGVPVVVVHDHRVEQASGHAMVVGVDGSSPSIEALRWAREEAELWRARLVVVHTVPPLPAAYAAELGVDDAAMERAGRAVLDGALLEGLGEHFRGRVEARVVVGGPAARLIEAARDAQLLVVGARGSGGFADLVVGSTAGQCVQHAPCPVAVVSAGSIAAG